jgi:hypothetical protein
MPVQTRRQAAEGDGQGGSAAGSGSATPRSQEDAGGIRQSLAAEQREALKQELIRAVLSQLKGEQNPQAVGDASVADGEAAATTVADLTVQELVKAVSAAVGGGGRGPPEPRPTPPEKFGGEPRDLRQFLLQVELYLAEFPNMDVHRKARRVGELLTGSALTAYQGLVEQFGVGNVTMAQVDSLLRSRFTNVTEAEEAIARLSWATQRGSVAEFANYLHDLWFTPGLEALRESELIKLAFFKQGLQSPVKEKVAVETFASLETAVQFACRVEAQLRPAQRNKGSRPAVAWADMTDGESELPDAEEEAQLPAYQPGREEQMDGKSPEQQRAGSDSSAQLEEAVAGTNMRVYPSTRCKLCKRLGHIKMFCPRNRLGGPQRSQENA